MQTVILLALILYFVYSVGVIRPLLQVFYPLAYQDIIAEQAQKRNQDPFLLAAIINVESKWRSDATSPKGAVGLMQLMPATAEWIAQQQGIDFAIDDLYDPKINITLGSWYIYYLSEQFPTFAAALAAYNAGPGNVRRWLEEETWNGELANVSDIPFWETRAYVQKISNTWSFYQKLYENQWSE